MRYQIATVGDLAQFNQSHGGVSGRAQSHWPVEHASHANCNCWRFGTVQPEPRWCKWQSSEPLACGACKSCQRPGFDSRVKQASQFIKSQTVVSTTERYFTLAVVCIIVECTKDSVRVTKKNIQIVVGWLGWKCIERSVLQLLLLKQKVERLLLEQPTGYAHRVVLWIKYHRAQRCIKYSDNIIL